MLRSLYSGVSGMRSFQTKMDVISNNIANVNTTGFKAGRVKFQDMLSQTISSAQGTSSTGLGGVNSQQIGLGVRVGAIDTIMTGGAMQPTNRDLDFAIEGEGFFALSTDIVGNNKVYSRDGTFFRDNQGNLVNGSGLRVLGYKPTSSGSSTLNTTVLVPLTIPNKHPIISSIELESYHIDGSGIITGVYEGGITYVLGQIGTVRFDNPEGLEKNGGNNYKQTNNSGAADLGVSGENGFGTIRQGYLEMSNVDLANEFTEMIVTSRAYQANSRSITTSDEMLQELINLKR